MSNNYYNFLNKQKDISSSSSLLLLLSSILYITLTPSLSLAKNAHLFSSSSLKALDMEGHFEFEKVHHAAVDFGNRYHHLPAAVLHPRTVADVALAVRHVWEAGPGSGIKIAARGHGHSLAGQSQARGGIVINMESLEISGGIRVFEDYVDVSGGELWVNVLRETLRHGLAPRSWTDYLHLTVGGTLSNAGVSGQAFRYGPQISNVRRLEVVTGKGEIVNCSRENNADLFHGVLGGLGQFGIITNARISLEPAPSMVRWIRVLYADFATFTRDQERLISSKTTFDYIEGFVIINRTGLLNNWRSTFNPRDPVWASQFDSEEKTLYCLELAKHFNPDKSFGLNQEIDELLGGLNYIPSTLFASDVTYFEFLDRVHVSELKLRAKGLWDVPHPWLNLLIPSTKIHKFANEVFGKILTNTANGPVLIYPVNKSKWDNRTSAVIPEGEIFYLVAFLTSAVPSSNGTDGLDHILTQNAKILDFCETAHLGIKQYLAHFGTQKEWRAHFGGPRWETFFRRKSTYDPLAMFSPGHRIFQTTDFYSSL